MFTAFTFSQAPNMQMFLEFVSEIVQISRMTIALISHCVFGHPNVKALFLPEGHGLRTTALGYENLLYIGTVGCAVYDEKSAALNEFMYLLFCTLHLLDLHFSKQTVLLTLKCCESLNIHFSLKP